MKTVQQLRDELATLQQRVEKAVPWNGCLHTHQNNRGRCEACWQRLQSQSPELAAEVAPAGSDHVTRRSET